MASRNQGRDSKTKLGLQRSRGEGKNVIADKDMSNCPNENLASIKDKPPGEKWLFSPDQLQNTPSRKDNVTAEKELNYRQQAANLIQDMGQRLPVNQLTINTAIVYMHRFYMFHSFHAFSRFSMAPTALFLAAKVEEQPRKLEHVIRVCHSCLHPDKHLDVHSDSYLKQAQQLVQHELIMLQTLGFDISIDHPHTHVVKCTQLVKASRDLSQMAYFMATNSLHLTTFCLKYKPTVVSAMCIHLSCKWSNYEIPLSSTGRAYWTYMDSTITEAMLENIIKEFLEILNLCPTRLRKLRNYKPSARDGGGGSTPQSKDGQQPKPSTSKVSQTGSHTSQHQQSVPESHQQQPTNQSQCEKKATARVSLAEYKTKREKELQSKQTNITSESLKPHDRRDPQNASSSHHGHQSAHFTQKHPQQRHGQHEGRPKQDNSYSGLKALLTEPETGKSHDKMQSMHAGHHKRPEKHPNSSQRPVSVPSGIPGLQKPKHPTTSHVTHQHNKDHQQRTSSQSHRPHHTQHLNKPQRPKDTTVQQSGGSGSHSRIPINPDVDLPNDDNPIAGVEQKIMEQMKAEKTSKESAHNRQEKTDVSSAKPSLEPPTSNHSSLAQKEQKSRHSMPAGLPTHKEQSTSHAQPLPQSKSSYKLLYDQYKKNPDALKHQLKVKAQTEPLNEEEKLIWQKIKRKEDDRQRRKRKQEKHRLNRSQPIESQSHPESGNVTPGGGPLTVRIKLPASVRAEMSKTQPAGGLVVGSSSGSGSEAPILSPSSATTSKSGRKRTHGSDTTGASDQISAKHSRKSEGHHHHSHHHSSSHDRNRHRHSRSGSSNHSSHHTKSQQHGQKIDNATFQQALVNAVSMVQSGQAAPGTSGGSTDKVVPTVTLKRTGSQNGNGDYVAQSSKHDKHKSLKRLGFDPSTPVSATPPEDLFEADADDGNIKQSGTHAVNAELSSPETGEIRDDDEDDVSPLREHVSSRSQDQYSHRHQRVNANNNNSSQQYNHQQWSTSSQSSSRGFSDNHKIHESR